MTNDQVKVVTDLLFEAEKLCRNNPMGTQEHGEGTGIFTAVREMMTAFDCDMRMYDSLLALAEHVVEQGDYNG